MNLMDDIPLPPQLGETLPRIRIPPPHLRSHTSLALERRGSHSPKGREIYLVGKEERPTESPTRTRNASGVFGRGDTLMVTRID